MRKFFRDYKILVRKYPEVTLGKMESKIANGFKIYFRRIYKAKGNKELISKMLSKEDLTVNQIAQRVNMTRQGVRFHVHNLEREGSIIRNGFVGGKKNILYSQGDVQC